MSDLNGTTQALTEQQPANHAAAALTELEQVENLLSGKALPETAPEAAPGGDPAAEAASEEDPQGEPETAEAEAGAVDYAQEIPLSNGTKVTLGELKDFYQAQDARTVELIERENKVMIQYAELQEMGQYLQLPPEVRAGIEQRQAQHLQQEHGLMLAAIPEFRDQGAFEKGRVAIFDLGKEYGVDLTQVTNHRIVKMLHDFSRLKSAIKTAKANVKQVKAPEPKAKVPVPTTKATDLSNAMTRAKQTGNQADALQAVDMLLRG